MSKCHLIVWIDPVTNRVTRAQFASESALSITRSDRMCPAELASWSGKDYASAREEAVLSLAVHDVVFFGWVVPLLGMFDHEDVEAAAQCHRLRNG